MRKNAIVSVQWTIFAALLVVELALVNVNAYLINQMPGIDKFQWIADFLKDRSYVEQIMLFAVWVMGNALIVSGLTWVMGRVMGEKVDGVRLPQIEDGQRQILLKKQLDIVKRRLADSYSLAIAVPYEDVSDLVESEALELDEGNRVQKPKNFLQQVRRLIPFGKGASEEVMEPQRSMMDVFRHRQVSGRLLILGSPGAGKTTALLELAHGLLEEARQDRSKPVPHIFELSGWDEKLSIAEWLALELKREDNLDPSLGRGMAMRGEILPLLDGLDELRDLGRIARAMGAINQYLKEDETAKRDVVVCCRQEDYGAAQEQLTELNGAVCLQPLQDGAIRGYLEGQGKGRLWTMAQQNRVPLLEKDLSLPSEQRQTPLLRTPLFLSVFAEVNPVVPVAGVGDLWNLYIEQRMRIPLEKLSGKNYTRYEPQQYPNGVQTRNHLIFLATQLKRTKPEFLIEGMQPDWLTTSRQKWQMRLISDLILGLIVGLILGLILGLTSGLESPVVRFSGLFLGLFLGLILGLFLGLVDLFGDLLGWLFRWLFGWLSRGLFDSLGVLGKIELVEDVKISMSRETCQKVFKKVVFGLILGLILGLIGNPIGGLIVGLITGLITGLIDAFKTDLKVRSNPNQGIWASAKNIAILTPIFLIIFGLAQFFLMPYLRQLLTATEFDGLPGLIAVFTILTTFSFGGGTACMGHFALRITLYGTFLQPNNRNSRAIPWNYARFLSYAADRKLLHQTGGSYRFIHRSLMEHFAELRIEN